MNWVHYEQTVQHGPTCTAASVPLISSTRSVGGQQGRTRVPFPTQLERLSEINRGKCQWCFQGGTN